MTARGLLSGALSALLSLPVPPGFAQTPEPTPSPPPAEAPPTATSPLPGDAAQEPARTKAAEKERRRRPDDKRRTLRSYGENLGYNMVGVVTRGNWGPLLVAAGATGPAMLLDDEFISYFDRHQHKWFGNAGESVGGGLVASGLVVGFFSAGRIARGGRFRSSSYDLSQAFLVNGAWTFALKYTIRRERPNRANRASFPSGHASNAFAGATVIHRHYGWKLGVPGYTLATLIAVSRMAKNAHHFSDIVAGAAFGYGVGRAVVRRNSRPPTPPGGPTPPVPPDPVKVDLWPDAGPAGDGVGIAVAIRF